MVIEALKAARDFIESDRQVLAESLTVNGEIVFEDDIDRGAMAEYVRVLAVIDAALEQALAAQPAARGPVQELFDHQQAAITALRKSMNRSVVIAKNTVPTLQKRPPNCGTGYCSCVECVMEPAPVQEPVGEKEISAWAERHDIQGTPTDLRSMFEDAASFTTPPAPAPVQEHLAWGIFYFGGKQDGKLCSHADTEENAKRYIADLHQSNDRDTFRAAPIYTTPPAAPVPLTDGQREEIAKGWRGRNWTVGDIIDATEAAHGITKGQP
jgi:hypothetical protein